MNFSPPNKLIFYLIITTIASPLLGGSINYENITIDKYTINYSCKQTPYNKDGYKNTFHIKISSKYNMFKMYNRKTNYRDTPSNIIINTDLYKIKPYYSLFKSKADVEIAIKYDDFERLSKTKSFEVIYPQIKFDDAWISKISNRGLAKQSYQFLESPKNVVLSSVLSTKGFKPLLEDCQDEYNKSKRINELQDIEDNKPINRLKRFFN